MLKDEEDLETIFESSRERPVTLFFLVFITGKRSQYRMIQVTIENASEFVCQTPGSLCRNGALSKFWNAVPETCAPVAFHCYSSRTILFTILQMTDSNENEELCGDDDEIGLDATTDNK